jgi:hypothetical protein
MRTYSLALTLTAVFTASGAHAQHGTYEAVRRLSGPDGRFEIRYTLRLTNRDASLTTELRSGRVSWNSDLLRRNGDILKRLEDRSIVSQTGDWRAGSPVQLRFTKLDSDFKIANYKANWDRDRIEIFDYDERLYGTERLNLRLTRGSDSNDGGSDDRDTTGRYELQRTWRSGRDDYSYRYRLDLERNGRAALEVTANSRNQPSRSDLREMGEIIARMDRDRNILLEGDWQVRNGRVEIDWNRLGGDRFNSRMRLERSGGTLRAIEYDRRWFADRPFETARTSPVRQTFTIGRDRPQEPDRPSEPNRPSPPRPNRGPVTRDTVAGDYGVTYPREGKWSVQRLLMLAPNGTAALTTQVNGDGAYDRTANPSKYGNLLLRLQNDRKHVVHRGSWSVDRDEVVVELEELGNENISVVLRFRVYERELMLTNSSRTWYGSAEMRLKRQ